MFNFSNPYHQSDLDAPIEQGIAIVGSSSLPSVPSFLARMFYLDQEGDGDEDGEDEHAAEAVEVQRPPAAAVHQRDGDERHDDHHRADADRGELGARLAQARRDEQVRRVVEHLEQGEDRRGVAYRCTLCCILYVCTYERLKTPAGDLKESFFTVGMFKKCL